MADVCLKRRAEDSVSKSPRKRARGIDGAQQSQESEIASLDQQQSDLAEVDPAPNSDGSAGETSYLVLSILISLRKLAVFEGTTQGTQRWQDESSTLQEYPSIQDIDFLRPDEVSTGSASDVTLETLQRRCVAAGCAILQPGDIILFRVTADHWKEIQMATTVRSSTFTAQQGVFAPPNKTLSILVPPGLTEDFIPGAGNLVFPNHLHPELIRAPTSIHKAARTQLPGLPVQPGETRGLWRSMHVSRDEEEIGTLNEMRLAQKFCENEEDLQKQLTFSEGRTRNTTSKIGSNAAKAGFHMYSTGTLFLKVKSEALTSLNQSLIIDLGAELNENLAELAEDEFSIVIVDNRGAHSEGIPSPDDEESLSKVLIEGPKAFSTEYTRRIAGSAGWTNGHAHLDDTGVSTIMGPFQHLYRVPAGKSLPVPPGEEVTWTPEEKAAAQEFHETEIKNRVRHYPLPLNRARLPRNIRTMQYRKVDDGWIVDTRAHPDCHVKDAVSDEDFETAMKMPRTRPLPARDVEEIKDGPGEGAPWAGYESMGRGSSQMTGRHATLENRFKGYEDQLGRNTEQS
ncbi:uncharacterized protein RSE6_12646 [Rhynchosporium secalis]|uniref:Uncharacterized protein n=1 Tax=Rhynchosporium secalis TaxID=38038 RepID=A0A1E1MQY4_RHYSE|nr:uncharacterized protein RSE6_12646 [Rhynchosporium secalis]